MTLGQRLKHLRLRRKYSMQELSDELNKMFPNEDGVKLFGKGKISKWESGNVDPSVSAIAKVAKFFNVSLDYLLGLEEENTHFPVVEVPILKNVTRDKEMYSPENIIGQYYIPNNLKISHQKLAYLKLSNKRMVLINFDDVVENDEMGLFFLKGYETAEIRKVQYVNEYLMLVPTHSEDHKPEIYESKDIKCIGKVISTIDYSNADNDFLA
ncbi:helix-turn-helix transcriptional regulator [Staphylococcus succinus]|uniref:helix-turn-helix domain-containing protein n=1 Tax=Staphylococcus succinus TaxID=61015 RepID=UPI00301BFAD9